MTVLNDIDEIVKRVMEQDHYAIARAISLIEASSVTVTTRVVMMSCALILIPSV